MSETPDIKKGLKGVVVDESAISKVMPEINALVYRGYQVQELAEKASFEEVAYLLFNDGLPNQSQLDSFKKEERSLRSLPKELVDSIKLFPKHAHPMDTIRSGMSWLGMNQSTEDHWSMDPGINKKKALDLLAKIPVIIAYDYRCRKGLEIIPSREDLSISENFFNMCFGEVPHSDVVKAFDVSLVLYAEHSFNASTFTARVIASTTSDLYSAATGAVSALKGPLHGGANEQVMHMLKEVGEASKAEAWMKDALAQKKKIMGFGHRVYRKGDSRAPTMDKWGRKVAELKGEMKWHEISEILEKTMVAEKGIYPNLDFPAGPAYYLMGFDIDMFTPIFVMSRITGWSAHIIEQYQSNALIRPLNHYVGPGERPFKELSAR